jgi:hypothetical protein
LFTDEDTDKNKSFSDSLEKVNDELKELEDSESWAAIEAAAGGIGFVFGLLGDAIAKFIEFNMKAGEGFGEFVDDVQDGWEAAKIGIQEDLDAIGEFITEAPGKFLKSAGKAFGDLGSDLLQKFADGFVSGPLNLSQKIKDALNAALPDSITFFGGAGGLPATTVKLPQFASGVQNFTGGLALVGERGPEVVSLPKGSDVYSNEQSRNLGGNVFNITTTGTVDDIVRELDWWARFGPSYA